MKGKIELKTTITYRVEHNSWHHQHDIYEKIERAFLKYLKLFFEFGFTMIFEPEIIFFLDFIKELLQLDLDLIDHSYIEAHPLNKQLMDIFEMPKFAALEVKNIYLDEGMVFTGKVTGI